MYKSRSNYVNRGNNFGKTNINWSYDKESAQKINTPQKPLKEIKCKINPNHRLEKEYLLQGPHRCKIICVDCGGMFVQWAKDDRFPKTKKHAKIKDEDYWTNKIEEFVKDHNDDPSGPAAKKLNDVLGIEYNNEDE